jgi:coenzyme F420-dependent glucose-6-phosphate dehydrogenase
MAILGWKAGPEQFPPIELLDYAVAAEEAGFESINVSDHFHPWSEEGQAPFTWTWLGAAAVRTKSIELGTGLTCPILRYHPAVVAQAAATLASMAPGRAFLCIGTGEALNEYAATGVWPGYETRQAMLKEALSLMRQLWTGEEVSFEGEYYTTRKARLYTLPEEPIPVYISSLVPASASFAGEHGDGLITTGGQEPTVYQKMLEAFEQGARQAGKDPTKMPRLIELNVAYGDDLVPAIEGTKKYWAGTFIPALFDQRIYTPKMSAENGKVVEADAIRKKGCFSSKPEDHVQFVQKYLELGFDQIYFHYAGADQKEFIQRYGRDVLPRLKGEAVGAAASNKHRGNGK